MKKLVLVIAVAGVVGLTSCEKYHSCAGSKITQLNDEYYTEVYITTKSLEDAQGLCEVRGRTWTEDVK
jgi:hypothetical protein